MEVAEGTDCRGGDATKGLADERDHLVALGEAISVVTAVGGDVAVAGGVVEWGLAGLATLLSAKNLPEQLLFFVAKRHPGGSLLQWRRRRPSFNVMLTLFHRRCGHL